MVCRQLDISPLTARSCVRIPKALFKAVPGPFPSLAARLASAGGRHVCGDPGPDLAYYLHICYSDVTYGVPD